MADKDEVKIQIKTALDSLGADQAKQVLKELQQEAEGAGSKGKAGMDKFGTGIKGVTTQMKALRTVMAGLGIIGFVKMLGDGVRKVDEMVNAKKRLSEQIQSQNDANAAQRLLDIYGKINEELKKANDELAHTNGLEDKRLENARKLEDAQMRVAEEREVDALGADDPDRAEKEKAIRARYAAKRGEAGAGRAEADIEREAKRMDDAAAADRKALAENENYYKELNSARLSEIDKRDRAQGNVSIWNKARGISGMYQEIAEGHSASAGKLADKQIEVLNKMDELKKSIERNTAGAAVAREGMAAAKTDAEASRMVSTRNVNTADASVSRKATEREEAMEAEAKWKRAEKAAADQQRVVDKARIAAGSARANREAFDSDRVNATTRNTRDRDARRAKPLADEKAADEALEAALRGFELSVETMKRYKRDFDKVSGRLKNMNLDAAGD